MNVPIATVFHILSDVSFDPAELAAFQQAAQAFADKAKQKSVDNSLPIADQEESILGDLPDIAGATSSNDPYSLDANSGEKSKLVGFDENKNPIWAYDTGDVSAAIVDNESTATVAWATFSASE